jgi:hypothetical protein
LILSVSTATFAMTTAWLAAELHRRDTLQPTTALDATAAARASEPSPGRAGPSPRGSDRKAPGSGAMTEVAATTAAPSGSAPSSGQAANSPANGDTITDASVIYARQLLARHDDSVQRQVLLEETRSGVRRQFTRLKEQLKLSDAAYEQLVALVAEQNLQAQERWARCAVDPGCDPKKNPAKPLDDRSQELLALLGGEGLDTFNRFQSTLGERDAVAQFRGRLADSEFLPQSQAERLIAALADERERYSTEQTARGASLTALGTNLGMVWYPEDAPTIEARLAEATQYSQRLRARAATVLTPAQLAAYVQMQDELLAQLASFLRPAPRKTDKLRIAQG